MKTDNLELIIIQDDDYWTVYPRGLPGVVVQTKHLEDAPKELAKKLAQIMEPLFRITLHEGEFEIVKLNV